MAVAFLKVRSMASSSEQALLGAHVPVDVAERFRAQARERDGSTAAALRRLIGEAVDGTAPVGLPAPRGAGTGRQIGVRLKSAERQALAEAARARGTTSANWLRSLALAHLTRRPQWGPQEVEALRDLFREVRRIGVNVNQIAQRANEAAQAGLHSHFAADQAREASQLIASELRKLGKVIAAEQAYWASEEATAMCPTGEHHSR